MAKYIEREAFIDHIRKEAQGLHTKMPMDLVIEGVVNEAKAFPAADVQPVRHGRWIDKRNIEHDGEWYCSECGNEVTICMCGKDETREYPYCPNCGAKMDKEEE